MTNYIISITIDNVIDALDAFITPFIGGATVFRAQANRVAMPEAPCVKLTEVLSVDLETPTSTYNPDPDNSIQSIIAPKRIDIQIDFYGENAGDLCAAVKSVYRTEYATQQFPDGIKPLYCSDGIEAPLITGEEQYERRWTITASLQYNPAISAPQQFADSAALNIFEDLQ